MKYNNIEFTKEDGIGILKINRPKALNALNTETVTELNQCVGEIENDAEVKVLIITGGTGLPFRGVRLQKERAAAHLQKR